MTTSDRNAAAAALRFGLGARPGELDAAREPRAWLKAQIERAPDDGKLFAGLPASLEYLREQNTLRTLRREAKERSRAAAPAGTKVGAEAAARDQAASAKALFKPYLKKQREQLLAELTARYRLAAVTDTPFLERLVHFWSNHFAVSVDKRSVRLLAAPMEREAIRPHVTGRFADMLLAVETHPAMLLYLDNVRSIGPDSRLGQRITRRLARKGAANEGKAGGLNENLGREALELHTVGVDGGYTQADVTELSRALTGWGVPSRRDYAGSSQPASAFAFHAAAHQPGARRVLGKTWPAGGAEQGRAILLDLARRPQTARHLALKLARHLVSDAPPPALVERMARSYIAHDTDLAAMYRTLIDSPEAWDDAAGKFKSPQDLVLSMLRAGQIDIKRSQAIFALLTSLGQPTFEPRSPAGFPDVAAHWIDANALWKRVQAAQGLSARVARMDLAPRDFAAAVLGPALDADTAAAMGRAESRQQAHAILFASPAFQWRI